MTLYNLVYLSSNIFNLYITKNFYELFLEHNKEKCRRTILAYILYFIATSSTYLLFEIPLLNLFVNIICFFIISLCYEGSITKKIFTTVNLLYGHISQITYKSEKTALLSEENPESKAIFHI